MGHVYFIYSPADEATMQKLRTDLQAQRLNFWSPASPDDSPLDALEQADAAILLMTPNAQKSERVRKEIALAVVCRVGVFSILTEGEDAPPYPIKETLIQRIDLRSGADYEREIIKLGKIIRHFNQASYTPIGRIGTEARRRKQQQNPFADPDETHVARLNTPEDETHSARTFVDDNTAPMRDIRPQVLEDAPEEKNLAPLSSHPLHDQDSNQTVDRVEVARRLGDIGDETTIPVLMSFLSSPDLRVREAAQQSIDRIRQRARKVNP